MSNGGIVPGQLDAQEQLELSLGGAVNLTWTIPSKQLTLKDSQIVGNKNKTETTGSGKEKNGRGREGGAETKPIGEGRRRKKNALVRDGCTPGFS